MIADPAIIIPVPLHRTRLLSRRYNQSAELARHFARLASLRYQPELLVRSRATKQQVGLAAKQRHQNVSGAFQVPKAHKPTMRGSHIVLIDDVYTTGATLQACSRTLKRAGALRVDFAEICEPHRTRCYL